MIDVDFVGQYFVGAPGLVWKQAYSSVVQYVKNDAVSYNGSSYVALQPILNIAPTGSPSDIFWATLAQKGDNGSGGSTVASVNGHTGVVVLAASDVGAATSTQGGKADTAVQPSGLTKAAVGLSNVDNTSDISKPVSTLVQASLDTKVDKVVNKGLSTNDYTTAEQTKLATVSTGAQVNTVTSVSSRTGAVVLTSSDVGLSSVNNTADISKPISTLQQAALDLKVDKVAGKQLSTNDYTTVEQTKLAGIATGAQVNTVTSVSGRQGVVTLTSSDVGLANVDNVSDVNKPISTATQTALNLKSPSASPTFTGTVSGITPTMVGLGNVTNTSDANKPVSTAQQTALNLKLDQTASLSNVLTSGTNASVATNLSVAPTTNSTQVSIGHRVQLNYSASFNVLTGGYLLSGQDVINTSGTGTHDKIVGRLSQSNFTGGNITSAIGFEAEIATLGATTLVGGYAGYYFPNLAGVANISNISSFACFSNDEPRAFHRSAGPYLNADLRELAPSRSAGLVSGRYYSAPMAQTMTQNVVAANVIYVTYIYVPRRCTPIGLGCNVTTAATGNVILGLYKVNNNQVTTIISQTASISTATTGAKEGVVATQVDSGVYALVAVFSGTPTISFHEINTNDMIGASSPTGYSEQAFISPFTFGALPSTANILPTFAANTIEPHLWFRI